MENIFVNDDVYGQMQDSQRWWGWPGDTCNFEKTDKIIP